MTASVTAQDCTILVVDDDASLTGTLKEFLSQQGYCVEVAHSAEEALAAHERNPRIHTYSAGVDVYMKRKKVALTSFYSLSAATGDILTTLLSDNPTMNVTNVTTGALVTPALAGGPGYYNYPNTTNRLHQVVTSVKFTLARNITPRIEYRFERYDQHDWQSDIMLPYMSAYDPGPRTTPARPGWAAAHKNGCIWERTLLPTNLTSSPVRWSGVFRTDFET